MTDTVSRLTQHSSQHTAQIFISHPYIQGSTCNEEYEQYVLMGTYRKTRPEQRTQDSHPIPISPSFLPSSFLSFVFF